MTPNVQIRRAARTLLNGGIVAYPTEGVYGVGCLPGLFDSVTQILALKNRNLRAGLILIAADYEQLEDWIAPEPQEMQRLLTPGQRPVTWIVTARPEAPVWLTGGRSTLAVRITSHPVAAALCRETGSALVSTSANRHGRPPALTALAVRRRFGPALDDVVAGPLGTVHGTATEMRYASNDAVFRPG